MDYCCHCGSLLRKNALFCPVCGQRVGVVYKVQKQKTFGAIDQNQESKPFKPNSNMTLAILTTIFCCVPLGVYAIVLANRVETLYYSGEYEKAEMAANDSKKWAVIGICCGIMVQIISLIFIIIGAIATDGEIFEYI